VHVHGSNIEMSRCVFLVSLYCLGQLRNIAIYLEILGSPDPS